MRNSPLRRNAYRAPPPISVRAPILPAPAAPHSPGADRGTLAAQQWDPDPPTYAMYVEQAQRFFKTIISAYNRFHGSRYRMKIETKQALQPRMTPAARRASAKSGLNASARSKAAPAASHCPSRARERPRPYCAAASRGSASTASGSPARRGYSSRLCRWSSTISTIQSSPKFRSGYSG